MSSIICVNLEIVTPLTNINLSFIKSYHILPPNPVCLFDGIMHCSRSLSTTQCNNDSNEGWFSKLLVRRIEPTKEPHSRMLADKEEIYELQTHNIRPDSTDKYLKNWYNWGCSHLNNNIICTKPDWHYIYSKENAAFIASRRSELNCELVASWTVTVGDLDQALHLWRYTGGFSSVDKTKLILGRDEVRCMWLLLLSSFWLLMLSYTFCPFYPCRAF